MIHSNIERLWTRWQATNGRGYEPEHGARTGHNLRDPLSQFKALGAEIGDDALATGNRLRPIDLLDPAPLQVQYQDPQP